jgi:hypothetical protein
MRRAWIVFAPMVLAIAYVACVGDDPGVEAATDAGADTSITETGSPDVSTGSDGAVDAGGDVDADLCAVPAAGDGVKCTASLTCPKGQRCCNSAGNGQRDCVTFTGCVGPIEVQCAARDHCSNGAEICCMTSNPADAAPSGTCPGTINAATTSCVLPDNADGGCVVGQIRLCGPNETCPAGTTCKQVDVNVGTPSPYRTGACL